MKELFLSLDQKLLELINVQWSSSFFDQFFPFWTDFQRHPWVSYFIFPLLMFFVYRKARWRGVGAVVYSLLAMASADFIFGRFLKSLIQRPRPVLSELPFEVILRGPHFGGDSFPSSHAVDAFCLAVILGGLFPKVRWWLLILASLTAYSRVYCGVHFPSDVVGGALLGAGYGYVFFKIYQNFIRHEKVKGQSL